MRRLLLSIHDVGPRFETEVDRLMEHVSRHVALEHLAMLVVPNHWGDHPLVAGSPFATRLRGWSDQGVSLFAHGWYHRDDSRHAGAASRFKARHMTAGEGEFLGLDHITARQRMADARTLIEGISGRPVAGFIAPAWLYGAPAMAALEQAGFMLAEDHMKVWSPPTGAILARGPVITWASRSRARIASSLAVARLLPPLLRRAPVVRVAVHPGDAHVPSLMRSIDDALRRIRRSHTPARYEDLLIGREIYAHPDLPA
ncbi:polysaccharide deacetylase family protein [Sphingobium sp. BYY-5]|uniref:polysaccharide deacetylase family protein n=1 Tax=Sphingobium sp. BYY-5 TaxID=2926400 RepID=UPI001FA71392|nr:polysaccharide deacetylase family protein [Sphingobium sp. BYY-5]MCI4588850.1 polysaccharide deacetylase family protein [Sphingobium sp. BYY-5]